MEIFFGFTLIAVFGYLLSNLILRRISMLERLGLSYILGLGMTTLLMFFYSWIGIKITMVSILLMLFGLILIISILAILLKLDIKIDLSNVFNDFVGLVLYEKIIFSLMFCLLIASFVLSTYYPVYVWDALALYDFTAKIVSQNGYFVQIASQYFYFAQYPLLVSFGHTIVYLFKGTNPQFIYSLYYLSLSLVFFSLIKTISTRSIAFFATFVLMSTSVIFFHSTFAYTNLPYTVFYVVGLIYFYKALSDERFDYLFMSSLLIGLSTWARSAEPFWMSEVFIVTVFSIYKKNLRPMVAFIIPLLLIQQPWNMFQANLYGSGLSTGDQLSILPKLLYSGVDFNRIIDVTLYVYRNIIQSWGPIVIVFAISVLFDLRRNLKSKNSIMLIIIVVNFLTLYVGAYVFSLRFPEWKLIPDSAIRMSIFFPPLMIYYICLVFGKFFMKNSENDNRKFIGFDKKCDR